MWDVKDRSAILVGLQGNVLRHLHRKVVDVPLDSWLGVTRGLGDQPEEIWSVILALTWRGINTRGLLA